jgi:uncharacterized protein YggT (Ycf19 family)
MATFFLTLYRLLQWLIYLYSLVIVIYCLFSWVPALRSSKLGEILGRIVEPYLHVFHLPTFLGNRFFASDRVTCTLSSTRLRITLALSSYF